MRYGMMNTRPLTRRNQKRLLRREGEQAGAAGGTPAPSGDNLPGNTGAPGSESGGTNNTVPKFDAEAFWNPPSGGEGGVPAGNPSGSAASPTPAQEADPNANLGQTLATGLQTMEFGVPTMTADMAKEMSEGNFDSFNTAMQAHGRSIAKQTLAMSVQVMRAVRDSIMADVGKQVQGEFGTREQSAALLKAIPSAAQPGVAPVVQQIYAQALTLSKGKIPEAIEMTKSMLKLSTGQFQQDDSLGIAPKTPGDSTTSDTNWLEELVGR